MKIKLASKYTGFSCTVLLITMVLFAVYHVEKLNESFFEEAIYEADTLSEMLLRTTYHQMLEDDRERLQQVIDEAGTMQRIVRIRVLGREGMVNFSTDKQEIGTSLSHKDGSCSFCHQDEGPALIDASPEKRSRVFNNGSGTEYLGMTKGIYNEKSCYTAECHFHSPKDKKLGVLDIVVSLDKLTSLTFSHHSDIFFSAVAMLIILSLFQYLFTQKYVCQPVSQLLEHTKRLSDGHLEARIDKWPRDELGDLCLAFNDMAKNLAEAQIELKEWANTLELKVEERTEKIKSMQNQLVQSAKLASMGELVAGIAHEINNPLGGILMFSSLAAKSPDLQPQTRDNLEVVVAETRRCAKIVRGLLEFSRESIPEKRPDSINRIIHQTLRLVEQQTLFQNIVIEDHYADDLPELAVDSDQLQQVFFNMFVNAGQAMPQGGRLKIETALNEGGGSVVIKIEDTGQGIYKEDLDKIFDPFFSTKSKQGFGLGLSITYGIINNHDGQITVESRVGVGTLFTICLPARDEAHSHLQRPHPDDGSFSDGGQPIV